MEALGLEETWWLVSPGNPLKPKAGMAPLSVRLNSARMQAKGTRIIPTAIEAELHTRFTVDTLRALQNRYKARRFVWLMGSDNLAQFHRWKEWRTIARTMPIAVIARPGYTRDAMTSPAMAWLRRYQVPLPMFRSKGQSRLRRAPALVLLQFDPDHRSATAIRSEQADWAEQYAETKPLRDPITHRMIRDRSA